MRQVIKWIAFVMLILGAFVILGAVGASDVGCIDLMGAFIRCVCGSLVIFSAIIIIYVLEKTED